MGKKHKQKEKFVLINKNSVQIFNMHYSYKCKNFLIKTSKLKSCFKNKWPKWKKYILTHVILIMAKNPPGIKKSIMSFISISSNLGRKDVFLWYFDFQICDKRQDKTVDRTTCFTNIMFMQSFFSNSHLLLLSQPLRTI